MEGRTTVASHKKWMMTLAILAGIVCLAGAGVFFFSRYEKKNAREYDGVLVWVQDRSGGWPSAASWRREVMVV